MFTADDLFKALTSSANPSEQVKALNALTEREQSWNEEYNFARQIIEKSKSD